MYSPTKKAAVETEDKYVLAVDLPLRKMSEGKIVEHAQDREELNKHWKWLHELCSRRNGRSGTVTEQCNTATEKRKMIVTAEATVKMKERLTQRNKWPRAQLVQTRRRLARVQQQLITEKDGYATRPFRVIHRLLTEDVRGTNPGTNEAPEKNHGIKRQQVFAV
ncbi:Hypp6683 [Branchiostoma lanceolatum]|uniref:Hypp6683 protein n=1 Tax=Branchiostoma lanceolatum TaxID=7740 RepID=A0A8J9YVC3_BRALA|nr:Hypp6683 [Branchiostoma lanceolatum]